MNESLPRPATTDPVEDAIGEMELTPKTLAGARARAMVGFTLAMGAFASITPTMSDTSVSAK